MFSKPTDLIIPLLISIILMICYQFHIDRLVVPKPSTNDTSLNLIRNNTNISKMARKLASSKMASDLCERIESDISYHLNASKIQLNDLKRCAKNSQGTLLIYIIDGQLYCEKHQCREYNITSGKGKKSNMVYLLLKSVLKMHKIPNTAFLLKRTSTGSGCFLNKNEISIPTFCIARKDIESKNKCILFPNMYFESLYQWKETANNIYNISKQIEPKKKKVFWLGGIDGDYGYIRGKFMLLANKSNLLETHGFNIDPNKIEKIIPKWKLIGNLSDEEIDNILTLSTKKRLKGDSFSTTFGSYVANINLPGKSGGSYSRHMQYMLALDTIPFLWDNIWYEWYYNALIHNYNIIKVNETNLYNETFRVLNMNDTQISFIKKNKEKLFDTHLSAEAIGKYIWYLLVMYQNIIGPQIDDWNAVKNHTILLS